jgi:hypothetical protein
VTANDARDRGVVAARAEDDPRSRTEVSRQLFSDLRSRLRPFPNLDPDHGARP